jgi:putative redox protein
LATTNVELDWVRDELFTARDRSGTALVLGRGNGTSPEIHGLKASDLLLISLIACSAHDVAAIVLKQRQEMTRFQVWAEGEQDDEPPWRFRKIRLRYKLCGRNLNESMLKRAIELAQEKYCSVYATLRDAVEITSDYEITRE